MRKPISQTKETPVLPSSLDEAVEAFEVAWNRDGSADVSAFLPDPQHPLFERIATELLCVDLEHHWQRGDRLSIDDYVRRFPSLLADRSILERLAFEEYRQLQDRGLATSPDDYANRFQIDTDHWPRSDSTQVDETTGRADRRDRDHVDESNGPQIGQSFLGFEIVERLGQGKFGQVYLARQADLADRHVVLKITTTRWCESDRLAKLQHTNIVPIHSVHTRDDLQVVCMPYFGRRTLEDVLQDERENGGTLDEHAHGERAHNERAHDGFKRFSDERFSDERFVLGIVSQIASGLQHAHERGILHRDLKPANILMSDGGQPLILDFNLSEEVVPGGRRSLLVGGTLPYMAPEHLRAVAGDGYVDERSDIYAVGVILFQWLTGRLPHDPGGDTSPAALDVLVRQRTQMAPSVRPLRTGVSPAVDSIVRHCLAPNPVERYQSADQLREDLDRQLQNLPLKYAPDRSPNERARKWLRRHPRLTSAGSLGLIAVACLAMVLGLLIVRGEQIAKLRAVDQFRRFEPLAQAAQLPLSIPDASGQSRQDGLRMAYDALSVYRIGTDDDWQTRPAYKSLNGETRSRLDATLQELLYVVSAQLLRQATVDHVDEERAEQAGADLNVAMADRYNKLACQLNLLHGTPAALGDQRVDILVALGRDEEAKQLASAPRPQESSAPRDRYFRAMQFVLARRYDVAWPLLEGLQQEDPQDFRVWFLSGNCLFGMRSYRDAELCLTRCITLSPVAHAAYYFRGLNRFQQRWYADAESDFTRALSLRPTLTDTVMNRALTRIKQGKFELAVEDYTAAIDLGREDSLPFLLRSKTLRRLGQVDRADRDLAEGLRRQPVDVDGWIQRGLARRSDDLEGALADLNEALRLSPSSQRALRNRAILLANSAHPVAEAIATLDRLVQLDPRNSDWLAMRGFMHARSGNREAAIVDARELIESSDSALTYYQAACIFAQTSVTRPSDGMESVKLLREALKRDLKLASGVLRDADLAPIVDREDVRQLLATAASL